MSINSRASLDRSPKKNWVENSGGLPMYIRRIANHLHQEKGMTIGHAIAVAVNACKRMCGSGDLNFKGKQNVNVKSRAEACAAVASWEKKKAGARVSKGDLGRKWSDAEFIMHLTGEDVLSEIHKGCGCALEKEKKMNRRKKIHKCEGDKMCGPCKAAKKKFDPSDESVKADLRPKKKKKSVSKLDISDEELIDAEVEIEEFLDVSKAAEEEIDTDPSDLIEFTVTGDISKSDDDKQLVFGWSSIAKLADGTVVVDKQGDVLEDIDQMEKVAYDFVLHSRDGGEMHVRKGVSTLVESFVSTPEKCKAMGIPEGTLPVGWWVGFKVHDSEVWKGVKEGKYRMFSVHGSGTRKSLEE